MMKQSLLLIPELTPPPLPTTTNTNQLAAFKNLQIAHHPKSAPEPQPPAFPTNASTEASHYIPLSDKTHSHLANYPSSTSTTYDNHNPSASTPRHLPHTQEIELGAWFSVRDISSAPTGPTAPTYLHAVGVSMEILPPPSQPLPASAKKNVGWRDLTLFDVFPPTNDTVAGDGGIASNAANASTEGPGI